MRLPNCLPVCCVRCTCASVSESHSCSALMSDVSIEEDTKEAEYQPIPAEGSEEELPEDFDPEEIGEFDEDALDYKG